MTERRYNEDEVALILRKAVDAGADDRATATGKGISLSELKEIGIEVGIDAARSPAVGIGVWLAAVIEVEVTTTRIDTDIRGTNMMQIGAGARFGAEAATAFRPDMFTIPLIRMTAEPRLGYGPAAVEQNDIVRIRWVLICVFQRFPDLAVVQMLHRRCLRV